MAYAGEMGRHRSIQGIEFPILQHRGQVARRTENEVEDPTCADTQVLQFRATLWEAKGANIEATGLPPFGDSAGSHAFQ